jgi:hypothetical protein
MSAPDRLSPVSPLGQSNNPTAETKPPLDAHQWVSATRTRAYLLQDPLLDWLERHGEQRGFLRDDRGSEYDPRTDFAGFILRKGLEFEAAVLRILATRCQVVTIAQSREDSRDPNCALRTFEAMRSGAEVIVHGVLHHAATQTYGVPDLLVRSDVLERLVRDPYAFDRLRAEKGKTEPLKGPPSRIPAPLLNAEHHYRVVDIKFTTLTLSTRTGELDNDKSARTYKAQLFVYNRALGHLQGFEPPSSFLLGRGWELRDERGSSCLDRLAPVAENGKLAHGEVLADVVDRAVNWIRQLRTHGANWELLPAPSVDELRPNMKNDQDAPWRSTKKKIADQLKDLTQMWEIGYRKRKALLRRQPAISRWDDPLLTAARAGVTGPKKGRRLQAILDVNRDLQGPPVLPQRIVTREAEWRHPEDLEFFVDFETVTDVDDDFSRLPEKGGQSLIFMVGCGHHEQGRFVFHCFTASSLTAEAEVTMLDEWFAHMASVRERLGFAGEPRVFHWSPAETSNFENAYNSATKRHPARAWPKLRWFDLLNTVVKEEPAVARGALGFGLKAFGKALHRQGLIQTCWSDGPTDGLGAMIAAWSAAHEAKARGVDMRETELCAEIERYNEVDCRVMSELLTYFRQHH